MDRIQKSGKTAIMMTIYSFVNVLMGFFVRIAFLRTLGPELLGLSGLFNSILGIMSFADLGLAGAFTCCLYGPIAHNENDYIKIILSEFKKMYRYIAITVTAVGLIFIPFLRNFVSGADNISNSHLVIYYLISLTHMLSSYFLMYKTSYVFAKQENYRLVKFDIIFNILSAILQFLVIIITKNYLMYLVTGLVVSVSQKISVNIYINKQYQIVTEPAEGKLTKTDKSLIIRNVKATIISKFGSICVTQVDNILISAGIGIVTTGLMSNYNMIKGTISFVLSNVQNAITAGMGDVVNKETEEVQMNVFRTYMMFNSWLVGFAMCGIGVLSTPFIYIVFGSGFTVDGLTVLLFSTAMYITYQTLALNVLPVVGGRLDIIQFYPLIEGLSNLILSIIGMKIFGLSGIFMGTLGSQVINYAIRPVAIFNKQFQISSIPYYRQTLKYFIVNMLIYLLLLAIRENILIGATTIGTFILMGVITVILYSAIQFALLHHDKEFNIAFGICFDYIKKILIRK